MVHYGGAYILIITLYMINCNVIISMLDPPSCTIYEGPTYTIARERRFSVFTGDDESAVKVVSGCNSIAHGSFIYGTLWVYHRVRVRVEVYFIVYATIMYHI